MPQFLLYMVIADVMGQQDTKPSKVIFYFIRYVVVCWILNHIAYNMLASTGLIPNKYSVLHEKRF